MIMIRSIFDIDSLIVSHGDDLLYFIAHSGRKDLCEFVMANFKNRINTSNNGLSGAIGGTHLHLVKYFVAHGASNIDEMRFDQTKNYLFVDTWLTSVLRNLH